MSAHPGTVHLVGAGPGDPGLMTVRAREVLAAADVVLHDRLIPDGVLVGLPGELVDVGKIGGGDQVPQEETHRLLLEHARAGRNVVRLKGGDPFVFGRGGEEAQLCAREGIPFEIVPGVTAGVAASAYAGIPVTQRNVASAVAFVTGHTQPASPAGTGENPQKAETAIDWPALASFPGTLVFYMGVSRLDHIAQQLIASGRAAGEPAAIVQRGTFADQRVVTAPLAELPAVAAQAGIRAPAITIVGPVAALHEELAWFAAGPLAGRSVAVTRARAQSSGLAARLRALGAGVTEAPAIAIEPLAVDLPDPRDYDLLVLTSPNGVHRLFDLVRDARALAGPRIAVVGPGTARALRQHGVEADIVPTRAVGEGGGPRPRARRAARPRRPRRRRRPLPHRRRAAGPRRPRSSAEGRLRHLHLGLLRALLPRGRRRRRRAPRRPAPGLHRPNHQRRAARARARAPRRGHRAHAGGSRCGARGRRERLTG
jgi:uroporphyrinogen III methyltransferase/synthase